MKVTERERQSGESFARCLKKFGGKVQEECIIEEARMRSKKMKPKAFKQAKQQLKMKMWGDYKWNPFAKIKRIGETT
jgi:ribosomal protein S21